MHLLKQADYHASNLPAGKLSTKGLGCNYPDPAENLTLPSGVVVPLGKEKKDAIPGSSLLYNEFIVYNVRNFPFSPASHLSMHMPSHPPLGGAAPRKASRWH